MYPQLKTSFKGRFPFKLGTTSFIYPDGYLENVKMLGPYVDEIELLLLQSKQDGDLPGKEDILDLARLGKELDITYNVHLPYDIDPGHFDADVRRHAVNVIKRVIRLCAELSPSTHTLHLNYKKPDTSHKTINNWSSHVKDTISAVLNSGVSPTSLSIENLNYPMEWVEDIVKTLNLRICLDIGHLLIHEFDVNTVFRKYEKIIPIIHLHGVNGKIDHLGLDKMTENSMQTVMDILKDFSGVVSIEVFSFNNLETSLNCLDDQWRKEKGV